MNMKRYATALLGICLVMGGSVRTATAQEAGAAPAHTVAFEAEDFTVEAGWKPIRMGEGNYAVDIIGFMHTSGERFLHAASRDENAAAFLDVTVPAAGPYRLWVRYEYMPFTEARFKIVAEQGGKVVAEKIMGSKTSLRTCPWSDGTVLEPQYDPPWGNEGLTEEPLDIPALTAGPLRLRLLTVAQPQVAGVSANRNIDCLYLTSDTADAWRKVYNYWYGILNAMRDARGARYEVQFTNRGEKPMSFTTGHYYNRNRFYDNADPAAGVTELAPGATSAWLPMAIQDTSHFGMARFTPNISQAFTVAVRPVGGAVEETVQSAGDWAGIYLPPYPGKGEKAQDVLTLLDEALAALKAAPAPGKVPTMPLCYGGCMPYGQDSEYGRKNAALFAAMGMRNTGVACNGGVVDSTIEFKNLAAVGLKPTRSGGYMEYRFPPTPENIAKAKDLMTKSGGLETMRWFDYGDEIGFGEWFAYMVKQKQAEGGDQALTIEGMILPLWQQWLARNRAGFKAEDYWRSAWGAFDAAKMRPDASAEAAAEKPRLYVDSVIFYEDTSIGFVAEGARAVKEAFGEQVLCGCNYSCYPYYYPHLPMYVKWFRMGAADYGKHSEYFWQLGQVTPMINGYVAEHFRAGMRFNPKAVLRQYTMPHSPGNTDANFLRTAFTHLAHGARNLDFFGIGFNETFTENYIDFRDHNRRIALRDVTHSMALVEDILEDSLVVPSEVALLVSDSTERWDHARIANDHLTAGQPARQFRQDRLTYHQERVGIYSALTFGGYAPDLVVEEDLLNPQVLDSYKVLYVVGECLPVEAVPALEKWVRAGGVLFATSGVGSYDTYRQPNAAAQKLMGIEQCQREERDTFLRTSQELPFIKPLGRVLGEGWQIPALATRERITAATDAQVLAVFEDDDTPALILRTLGEGRVYYAAALPGVAYLWAGLQPPAVPDRARGVHRAVTTYDPLAVRMLALPLSEAGLAPRVSTSPDYIDTRLIGAKGAYILPLANYNEKVGRPAVITIRPPCDPQALASAVSAYCGPLKTDVVDGQWVITIPKLGYGDIVRLQLR